MKNELTKSHQEKSQKSPTFLEIPRHLKMHINKAQTIIFSLIDHIPFLIYIPRNFATAVNMVKEGQTGPQSPSQKR